VDGIDPGPPTAGTRVAAAPPPPVQGLEAGFSAAIGQQGHAALVVMLGGQGQARDVSPGKPILGV